jgi:crotonobetainyl-CoA:carnitine CoA-transferase CaiB-like acyl-CoA transferase
MPLVGFSRSATLTGNAGLVGQDTARVLRDYGYVESQIAEMAERGVILLG